MGRAEHHLLDAADAIVADVDSLAEQRDEFDAILRSMTEAVVVTGARGEVILLNGAARRIFALGAETDYRDGRSSSCAATRGCRSLPGARCDRRTTR